MVEAMSVCFILVPLRGIQCIERSPDAVFAGREQFFEDILVSLDNSGDELVRILNEPLGPYAKRLTLSLKTNAARYRIQNTPP